MSRYIDADTLPRHGQRGGLVHWKDIAEAQTIDIVRCKECYMCDEEMWCSFYDSIMESDDYCSYGEREGE